MAQGKKWTQISPPQIRVENQYNLLVQLDYLVGLCTAYMLGAGNWFMFFLLLAISLGLGVLTIRVWVKTMRSIVEKGMERTGET